MGGEVSLTDSVLAVPEQRSPFELKKGHSLSWLPVPEPMPCATPQILNLSS